MIFQGNKWNNVLEKIIDKKNNKFDIIVFFCNGYSKSLEPICSNSEINENEETYQYYLLYDNSDLNIKGL